MYYGHTFPKGSVYALDRPRDFPGMSHIQCITDILFQRVRYMHLTVPGTSRECHIYYRIIITVERDTGKYHEFIAGIVYECAARVNNAGGNERVMFPRYRVLQW